MPVEAKPLFRPAVLRGHLANFLLPLRVAELRPKLDHWAALFSSGRADAGGNGTIWITLGSCEARMVTVGGAHDGYTRSEEGCDT